MVPDVLDCIPVLASYFQLPGAVIDVRLGAGEAGSVFLLLFYDLVTFQIRPLTPDGDELPITVEAGLFG